jgi:molybdate/tungstate transport system substrate-binding protein
MSACRKNTFVLTQVIIIFLVVTSFSGCISNENGDIELKVFHAGSLSGPLGQLEAEFEGRYHNIDIHRESAGSADTIRKVTELGKIADVVASADYTLIKNMMIDSTTSHADWYIQFAVNQLVIAYTDHSTAKSEITANNWYKIFNRDDVNFGFSNPNADPCGYRALMMIQLAEEHNNSSDLFEDLIVSHSDISISNVDDEFTIETPENLDPDDSIMIRPKETDLMAQLEAGELDYLIIYRSVAYQHRDAGVKFIELPTEINLKNASLAGQYGKVFLQQYSDQPGKGKLIKAKPIVYGITIPTNSKHPQEAENFVQMLLGQEGQIILSDLGQPPIVPARASNIEKVPDGLKELVVQE